MADILEEQRNPASTAAKGAAYKVKKAKKDSQTDTENSPKKAKQRRGNKKGTENNTKGAKNGQPSKFTCIIGTYNLKAGNLNKINETNKASFKIRPESFNTNTESISKAFNNTIKRPKRP